ncbi:Phthioceranic/hydroxyphthioceranic acid synthase [Kutzneria albida DSM 43870]|uniref:Phthioceranic/hydroxyphthioceranic acid synthase n=2 Tax=Kutzneria TaxID=43356 RepID=W5W2H8_9PSEU|nr:Phthioceranic/hydroxyphthioceranic acid synthase [Kutzneria albida DSM 43870]
MVPRMSQPTDVRADVPARAVTGDPIAIVGMACRYPGGVEDPAAFWRLLVQGRDVIREGPQGRWDFEAFFDPDIDVPGRCTSRWAGYFDDITGFDAAFFGISPREATTMDPQHRLLIELAWEALERAGMPPRGLAGSRTGVFVGLCHAEYIGRLAGRYEDIDAYMMTGNGHSTAVGRISYLLGLTGPSVAVDTACSSSLVAMHLACQSLRLGESDLALASGVNLMINPETPISYSKWGMLSPTGRCHPFSAGADGFVRGEGAGTVVLKRLDDAVRDGDQVLALVRGTGVNQDGRSQGLTAPSADAQRALFRETVRRAGVRPGQFGLVETHGAGTPIGDPIEFDSLSTVYGTGEGRCALGGVKSNVGHTEAAAGISGVIKSVLSIGHGVVPPTLNFTGWNSQIDPEPTRFFVPTEPTPWPVPGTRLAAVSSFGVGGTNAHVLLEQAPRLPERPSAPETGAPRMIPISAASTEVLGTAASQLADWLHQDGEDVSLGDLAHTLAVRRSHHLARLAVSASSVPELIAGLEAFAEGEPQPNITCTTARAAASRGAVWVFSGQGSQWSGMGRELLASEPVFAEVIAGIEPLVAAEAGFSVTEVMSAPQMSEEIDKIQPTLFAMQVALAELWRANGVEPAAVIGHSMGETAAAVVAGGLSLADGVLVICRRSRLMKRASGLGTMASVDLSPEDAVAELAKAGAQGVTAAVLSSPRSTVISGDTAEVERIVELWQDQGLMARRVAVDIAAHSTHMDPLLAEIVSGLAELRPSPCAVPVYSTVLADPRQQFSFDPEYWAANLRQPVRFTHAVRAAAEDGFGVFVEVSPHPVTTYPMSETLSDLVDGAVVLPTMKRDNPPREFLSQQLGALYCAGAPIDWQRAYGVGRLVDAPTLTWDRKRHWIDLPMPHPDMNTSSAANTHPLLGVHVKLPEGEGRHVWQGDLGTAVLPWLADHRVDEAIVLPGAGFTEMVLAAGSEHFRVPAHRLSLSGLVFHRLLPLDEHTEVSTVLSVLGPERVAVSVLTSTDDGVNWVTHATGEVVVVEQSAQPAPAHMGELLAAHSEVEELEGFYAGLRADGYFHGPCFAGLTELRVQDIEGGTVLGRIKVPGKARSAASAFRFHPVLFDSCLQALGAARIKGRAAGAPRLLPAGVGALRVYADPARGVWCEGHAVLDESDGSSAIGRIRLLDADGAVLLEAEDIRLLSPQRETGPRRLDPLLHEVAWQPEPLTGQEVHNGQWLLVGEGDGFAAELAASLGPGCRVLDLPLGGTISLALDQDLTGVVVLPGSRDELDDGLARVLRVADVVRSVATSGHSPRVWIVTERGQAVSPEEDLRLSQSALRGIGRVAGYEHAELGITLVDVDSRAALARELLSGRTEDEVAWRGEERLVARLVKTPLHDGTWQHRPRRTVHYGLDGFAVDMARPGNLDSMGLVVRPRVLPGPGEVEIQVQAAALNFRDVLVAMGLYPTEDGTLPPLGGDCAGVVTRTGPGVSHLQTGDWVFTLANGAFATFVTTKADLVAPIPAGMRFAEAAVVPAVYLTAWYGLVHLARLAPGERVLIHSGTGGVGLAAIAIARSRGAEVLATAGSEEKREYLRRMGIEHVMDSRSLDFAEQTMRATGGHGVDVVLNSLVGPALRAGLDVLAIGGRFIELGKRDIYSDSKLGMSPFRRNITISSVDLDLVLRTKTELAATLMSEVAEELSAGRLDALPRQEFPIEQAADAFRTMAAAKHIGKLVLTVPEFGVTEAVVPEGLVPVAHADGAYVITGGLGGLGLEMARWLAGQGAGRLVLNGRSAPSAQTEEVIAGIQAAGTQVEVVRGDVTDPVVAQRLVRAASEGGCRVRGVLHSAAVLDDGILVNLDADRVAKVWRPKVDGAWRLHEATEGQQLDWFVLFSSAASMFGNPGQSNYAAANAWLDAFAAWRRHRGLPALTVNWGAWGQAGRATDFAERGFTTLDTQDGIDALHTLLDHERVRTGVFAFEGDTWFSALPSVMESSFFAAMPRTGGGETATASGKVRAELSALEPDKRPRAMVAYLGEQIRIILGLGSAAVEPDVPLTNLGFDSLTALQLRNQLEADLAIKIPATAVWTHPTPAALGAHLLDQLGM